MDKMAQRRGVLNQLREKINMPGNYLEGFFKPELDRVMNLLNELDDRIRATMLGKKVGDADPPADGLAAKDLVKSARTNFNRREYIAGIVDLGNFHKKMFEITKDIDGFKINIDTIHNKFLFEGLPEQYQNNLKGLREHMSRRAAQRVLPLKEAGIMDFFYNIGTKRGRSLAAWEKKYPRETRALREGGIRLVDEAEKLLNNSLTYLKQMATARVTRRPDEYVDLAHKITGDFNKFDKGERGFTAYYNNVIMPFLKTKDALDQADQKANAVSATPAPAPAPIPTPEVPDLEEQPFPLNNPKPIQVQDSDIEESIPNTQRRPQMTFPDKPPVTAHQKFMESLQSLSQENPLVLAGYIAKYASLIQKQDLPTAIKLFSIVRTIRG